MKRLRTVVWKAALISSFVAGTSPAGAVGDNAPIQPVQTTLVSKYQVEQLLDTSIKAHLSTVTFKYKGDIKKFEHMLDQVLLSSIEHDPYMRYIIDRYNYKWRGSSTAVQVTVSFVYRESAEQSAYVNQRVKEIAAEILTPGMNAHEKVKAVHDFVVRDLKYDLSLRKYTAYEGLATGEAVCQGYSLLTYKLLKEAGIHNIIMEGTAGGQPHAWNLVLLQNKWYHLDTTWDDPVPNPDNVIDYSYYLLSDRQIRKDHAWSKSYPQADAVYRQTLASLEKTDSSKAELYKALERELGYDLYRDNQAVKDSEGLMEKVGEAVKAGEHAATVRYAGQEASLLKDLSHLYELMITDITYSCEPLDGTGDLKVRIEWRE
ncbi:transglutaminase domain-containing protein [Paenibacillus caui]|uniref:transglutaminase domain-containing protein n=1 Tax=Paenibacillus caui TaxID=2873927 RepID=UPI001CA80C6A|nr:transglutaminase domain-containing protein [Paenibacillus caui]